MKPSSEPERRSIDIDGRPREYLISRPPGGATGIVLSLHGRGSTATMQASFSGMDRLARTEGAVVVFPQGSVVIDRRGYMWDGSTDLPYLTRLIERTREEFRGVRTRVCVSGMSAGAWMACAYAAARADDVAALGAVAGLRPPPVPPVRQVPVIAFHGMKDRYLPYLGGPGGPVKERVVRRQNLRSGRPPEGPGAVRREAVPEAALAWARSNGVEGARDDHAISATLRRTTYGEGTPGEVTLWTSAEAGHTWPGHPGAPPMRLLLGRTSREVDATLEIWRFFDRQT
jgi:polyhydroxybutyrate depolymerase